MKILSEKYQQIKNIFSDILETEPLKEISIKDYRIKIDYIKDVYNHITQNKYADIKKDVMQFLEISHSKLDVFLIEIICSNLYCDLALILQIVCNKTVKHEYLISSLGIDGDENKTKAERLRKRLQPNRINTMEELKLVKDTENVYFAPTVASAYKEALLVKRSETDILDISKVFIDIFKALFCEAEENSKSIRLIRSYRLWEFTPETIHEVAKIYQQVLSNENSYKYAEIIFLERLFGLLTLNEILSKDFNKKDIIFVTESMRKMHSLGYSSMTKLIASKINHKNHHVFDNVITQYIYPLCSECITTILQEVITYLATRKIEEREEVIERLLKTCSSNLMQISDKGLLENIKSNYTMDMFMTLFDLPQDIKKKENKTKALIVYLASQSGSYSYTEEIEGAVKTISIVNDRSYESLYYPQYITYPDFDNEDKPKISRRIKY